MTDHDKKYTLDVIASLADRTIKRLWIVVILSWVLICVLAGVVFYQRDQYEKITTTIDAVTDNGGASIVANENSEVTYNVES